MSETPQKEHGGTIALRTIEAYSRSVYREALKYGFEQVDVIRLINMLMDLCTSEVTKDYGSENDDAGSYRDVAPEDFARLPLTGSNVRIRPFDNSTDRALLESWLPDRYGRFFVLSCATAQKITVSGLSSSPNNHLGTITTLDGEPIGSMAYLDVSEGQKRAELRKLIGSSEFRGKGLAEEATKLWINYGIHGLGLKKIYVSTLQTQVGNIKLNERVGFQVEGLLRNEVLIDGHRHDVLRMGLTVD